MQVTFARTRRVKVYIKVKSSEVGHLWWDPTELKSFRKACAQTISCFSGRSKLYDSTDLCTRGLENWTSSRFKARRQRIKQAVQIVLGEQRHLREQGIEDPNSIAEIYQAISCPAQVEARMLGLQDEDLVFQQCIDVLGLDDEAFAVQQCSDMDQDPQLTGNKEGIINYERLSVC